MPSIADCLRKSQLPSGVKNYLRQQARDGTAKKAVSDYLSIVEGNITSLAEARKAAATAPKQEPTGAQAIPSTEAEVRPEEGRQDIRGQGEVQAAAQPTRQEPEAQVALPNADPSAPPVRRGVFSFGPVDKVVGFIKRNFTSKGDLPKKAFDEKIKNDGRIGANNRQIAFTMRDFKKASKKAYKGKPTPEQIRQLDDVLKGAADPSTIPEQMRPVIAQMRSEIDQLSRLLIESGAIEGDLIPVVEANIGFYATRAYRVFDDPNWAAKVPQDVRNKAKALLRQEYPERSEQEIEGLIENLLFEGKAAESPIAVLKGGKLGSKDLSIIKRRKDIAPEIRALWGEFQDPRVNYTQSVAKMTRLISNHKFLEQVRIDGLGEFLFEKPIVNENGEFVTRIAADESSTMYPLNGLYTKPEIKRVFEEMGSHKDMPAWFQWYMRVNGIVKYSKTVASLQTHVRNLVGNTGFAVANGHWRLAKTKGAFKTVMTDIGVMNSTEYREYIKKLRELGVIHESARAGELRDVIKDAGEQDIDQFSTNTVDKIRRGTIGAVTTLYRLEDDVWKVYAFENEKARYTKARPEWSEQQVETRSAEIVRNTYPTYSLVSRGVKGLRRFPVLGTFVSFPAEVARTAANSVKLAATEMADPATRAIGIQRSAGLLTAASATAGIAAASRHLLGIGDDEDEDVRRFLPPWSENSQLVYIGYGDEGKLRFIDLSYTDPYEYLKKPIIALMRGEDTTEAIVEAVKEAMEPFATTEILAQAIIEVVSNKKKRGGRVYNPQDDMVGQLQDITAHLGKTVEPGTITSARKVARGLGSKVDLYGRSYNPKIEALAVFSGHRVQELDVPQALVFRGRDYLRNKQDAQSLLRSIATRRGDVSEDELRNSYQEMERSRRRVFDEATKDAQAAIRLGMTRDQAVDSLVAAGIGRVEANNIADGIYFPYVPTSRFLQSIARSAQTRSEEVGAAIEAELERRRGVIIDEALREGQ